MNLAYRWFCRLDLTDPVPDHSIFSKNRRGRFRDRDLLRHVFETVVARCIEEGLASGQRFAADASLIQADANRQNSSPQDDWEPATLDPADAPRAVREYLDTLDDAAFGAASPVKPKFTSHSDPASQWTGRAGRTCLFCIFRELPDRHRQCCEPGYRGHPFDQAGRGWRRTDDGGPGH
ncbi:hypothetical protein A9D60_07225 [Leisingera sp. JC1]|nr:hypothetical protein A9D60_07225 [Leisingera sp. JC1]